MAIMKWNSPPPGGSPNHQVKQGLYDAHGEHAARSDSLHGELMFKPHDNPDHAPAGRYNSYAQSTEQKAAYVKKEPTRPKSRDRRCPANDDTCKGWARKDTGYCFGHSVSMGLKAPPNVYDADGNLIKRELNHAPHMPAGAEVE